MCNVQHFGNIVVTLLPNMFEAVHHYHDAANVHTEQYEDDTKVEPCRSCMKLCVNGTRHSLCTSYWELKI